MPAHQPVLQKEILEIFNPKKNENFIDCTIGEGGHSLSILEKTGPRGKLLGIDLDSDQIENCRLKIKDFSERTFLINNSYANLKEIVEKIKFGPVQGILLDLGMSSWHLEESKRGFSFLRDEELDMRYDIKSQIPMTNNQLTAEKIINEYPEAEIEKILKEYGEEFFSKNIAKEIVRKRKIKKIKSTFDLIEVIKKALPKKYQRGKIHFATRTFQGLRIAVNDELNNLKKVLPQAIDILSSGGRIVVISFHSLEDRIVKNFFKEQASGKLKILTKKPITPLAAEIEDNKRARSAKLRAAIKI